MEVRGSQEVQTVPAFLLTPPRACQQQEHTDTVQRLRFTLDFARCLVEVAGAPERDAAHSSVADQISSLSREWRSAEPLAISNRKQEVLELCCRSSHAEQLVLYLKSAELLSGALHTAMERVRQGQLYPSATVKQGALASCRWRRVSLGAGRLTRRCVAQWSAS